MNNRDDSPLMSSPTNPTMIRPVVMEPVEQVSPVIVDGRPDWDAFVEDVPCPLCDYNMRGLPSPRCPECGGQFTWPDLLDSVLGKHPFLFEHHSRDGVWSFYRTLTAGLLHTFFWRSVKPSHQLVESRLRGYFWITLALGLALNFIASNIFQLSDKFAQELLIALGYQTNLGVWGRMLFYDGGYRFGDYADDGAAWSIIACFLWLLTTFFSLRIFQPTLSQAKIRRSHLLRVCIYCGDTFVWMAAAGLTLCLMNFGYGLLDHSGQFVMMDLEFATYGLAASLVLFFVFGMSQRERMQTSKPPSSPLIANVLFISTFLLLISYIGTLLSGYKSNNGKGL